MPIDARAVAAGMLQAVAGWIRPTIDAIDMRLLGHGAKNGELSRRLDKLDQRLSAAEKKQAAHERRFGNG